jgi:hypothetical protein
MGLLGAGKFGRGRRPRALQKRWSNLVIVITMLYFSLLLDGLSYAVWFRVA